jgi:hypothetical protein
MDLSAGHGTDLSGGVADNLVSLVDKPRDLKIRQPNE